MKAVISICLVLLLVAVVSESLALRLTKRQSDNEGCKAFGRKMKVGEERAVKMLRHKCKANGKTEIVGCKSRAGKVMTVGQDIVDKKNNVAYRCFRGKDGYIYYHEFACGDFSNVPKCDPLPPYPK